MVTRRKVLASGAAALAVVAWDQTTGRWLTAADAAAVEGGAVDGAPGVVPVPPQISDRLFTDAASTAVAADDFGHIVSHTPWAVLKAESTGDIATLIKWANQVGLQVAARGQAHSVLGEGQVEGGVVIDMNNLNTIHDIGSDYAVVDAGVKWSELLTAAGEQGLTPLVLTDYLELSIGGVLAVGGIGGNMNQVGMVVDNVDAITVVTGKGQIARNISPTRKADLFDAALGGLGQAAIITQAQVRLGPAPALVRIYELTYSDITAFAADQRTLVADARFGYHEGQVVPDGTGGWQFKIEVGAYYTPPSVPDDAALLAGLTPDVSSIQFDLPYAVWLGRVGFAEIQLRAAGLWDTPHPWSDLFLADAGLEDYVTNVMLPRLTPEGVGAGLVLLYPFRTSLLHRPFARIPAGEVAWAFDILRFPFDPTLTETLLTQNRELYEGAVAAGGNFYPIGALESTPTEWQTYYGDFYPAVVEAKRRHDPNSVLTPGQGLGL